MRQFATLTYFFNTITIQLTKRYLKIFKIKSAAAIGIKLSDIPK
jgi:hypothetical protein